MGLYPFSEGPYYFIIAASFLAIYFCKDFYIGHVIIMAAVIEIFVYTKGQINTYMSIPACVALWSILWWLNVKSSDNARSRNGPVQTNLQVFHICPLHVLRALRAIKNHQWRPDKWNSFREFASFLNAEWSRFYGSHTGINSLLRRL